MNERMFNHDTQAPNKVGPFLPGLKARGILDRFGEANLLLSTTISSISNCNC